MTEKDINRLKLEKDQIVCVVWEDIRSCAAWMEDKDLPSFKPSEVRSFGSYGGVINGGVLVKHNIAQGIDPLTKEDDTEFDGTIIPVGVVLRIRKLRI